MKENQKMWDEKGHIIVFNLLRSLNKPNLTYEEYTTEFLLPKDFAHPKTAERLATLKKYCEENT